jgi:hypothetical protein
MKIKVNNLIYILVLLLYIVHIPFDSIDFRIDIFLFYDYSQINKEGRHIANIVYDISVHLIVWILFYKIWKHKKEKIVFNFLIWWSFNIVWYILRFGQDATLIGLPLLVILLVLNKKK